MVTPFDSEGSLDVGGAGELARWLADRGSESLVVAGSTGEGSILSDAEKLDLWSAVRDAVQIPVIASTGSASTGHTVELTTAAAEVGCDAALVVTPYYVRPSQEGLYAHFAAVAAATTIPLILYDIPVRSGRQIARSTTVGLASDFANIVAIKDSGGDPSATARLVAETPDDFEVYCGDDAFALSMLSVGAVGLISVASHWAGARIGEMIASFFKGDVQAAAEANRSLLDSWSYVSSEKWPNPLPAKAMMRVMGLPAGQCRLPLGPADEELEGWACKVLAGLERETP